jgi:hypothetical protein
MNVENPSENPTKLPESKPESKEDMSFEVGDRVLYKDQEAHVDQLGSEYNYLPEGLARIIFKDGEEKVVSVKDLEKIESNQLDNLKQE